MNFGRSKDDSTTSSTQGGSSSPSGFTAEQRAGQQALNDRLTCSRLEDRDKDAPPGSF
ncbi:hypothetical protein OG883_43560 [Streptomyces sp. NBC_01142]|uniref:hypothetical protein n=1 Tax=Streptomyces sp. NBC_01142 TaxID=2975865 RepID=UPI00225679E8|nr:hypothetical protein [Streptomyces sp. NBC_01142]MCX4826518.1 hypothetical protein [Streptomyces sp. NBC_01142]